MKLLLSIAILASSLSAFAYTYKPEVVAAAVDASKQTLTVTVRHGGGCGEHNYSLKMGLCLETYPVQCSAELFDDTEDYCEAYLTNEVVFTFRELGLNNSYFNGASLTITGAQLRNGQESSATVKLPFR